MANGTWDEASKCPKCELTGEAGRPRHVDPKAGGTRGARLVTMTCKNKRCRWYNSNWEVQINPDGTIPDPNAPREKRFQPLDAALAVTLKDRFQTLQEMTEVQGAEVRRR